MNPAYRPKKRRSNESMDRPSGTYFYLYFIWNCELEGEAGPGPSHSNTKREKKSGAASVDLNETIDYVALVQQHLADEKMAKDLQNAENVRQLSIPTSFRATMPVLEERPYPATEVCPSYLYTNSFLECLLL